MKKKCVFVLFLTAFFMLNATNVNIFGGVGSSIFTGDVDDDIQGKVCFGIGGSVDVQAGGFIIEPGIRFYSGGSKYEESEYSTFNGVVITDYEYKETFTLNYLDIFAKAKFPVGSFMPYIGLGMPTLLSATGKAEESNFGKGTSVSIDLKKSFTSTNFNLMLGADFVLLEKFIIGLEYSRSLNNILSDEDAGVVNLNNFMLNVGFKLGI